MDAILALLALFVGTFTAISIFTIETKFKAKKRKIGSREAAEAITIGKSGRKKNEVILPPTIEEELKSKR